MQPFSLSRRSAISRPTQLEDAMHVMRYVASTAQEYCQARGLMVEPRDWEHGLALFVREYSFRRVKLFHVCSMK